MASLQVRDLPEHIHLKLLDLARQENRSLAQQAISVLAAGLSLIQDPKARRREAIVTSEALHSARDASMFPDPVKLVREDRDR